MKARQLVTGLAGAAAMIALVNIASRVVGFLRWGVMLSEVGADAVGNAYTSANALPNVLFEVVAGGALAGAVVPLIAAPLARSMRRDVDRTASALVGWALAVLVPLALVVALLARPLVGLFMQGKTEVEIELAATFLTAFAVQIPLYGIGVVLTGVLQAQRRFLAAAMAPLLNSLVVIAAFFAFGRMVPGAKDDPAAVADAAVALLGWGTTAGVAVMTLSLLWPAHRTGVRLRPTLAFPEGVAVRARALAVAGLGAVIAQQVSVLAAMTMSNAHGGAGTFPVFLSTQAVYLLPYAVLAFPLATATLPRLAERATRGDRPGFALLTASTTRAVLLVSGIGAAALVAVAPAVEQVFVPIAKGDVTGMAEGLTWMAPGLLGFGLILHLSRALYALHRGRVAVTATASGWFVMAVAAVVLVPLLVGGGADQVATLQGLGVANSIGMTVAGVGLVVGIVRSAGRAAVDGLARTGAALVVASVAGAWLGRWCVNALDASDLAGAVLSGVLGAAVCGVVVGGLMWLFDRSVVRTLRGRPGPADAADVAADVVGLGSPESRDGDATTVG